MKNDFSDQEVHINLQREFDLHQFFRKFAMVKCQHQFGSKVIDMRPHKELCPFCPLRDIGLGLVSDIQPENGVLIVHRLKRHQVLESDLLSHHFLLLQGGSLKVEYIGQDGRHEISAFLFPGESVVAAYSKEPAVFTALEETVLCEFNLSKLHNNGLKCGPILKEILGKFGAQAALDQKRLIQARTGAVHERLHWFLEDICARTSSDAIKLKMSRDDIASYIDTTAESVSRAFSFLADAGVIIRKTPRQIQMGRPSIAAV